MSISNRTIIIDAYNLFTRHYVAHPGMSKNGEQVGGVVGFFNNMLRLVERINPEKIYVVWEGGGSQRKRTIYSEYKSGRRPAKMNRYYEEIPDSVENRNFQVKMLISLLSNFPLTQIYVEDAEADDAIGYMAKYKLSNQNIVVISSDHDFYQLINDKLIVWSPTLKSFVNCQKVIDRFGIHPNNFCLARALSGDKSDNIEGVDGIGLPTVAKRFPMLKEDKSYTIDELLNVCKTTEADVKAYKTILEQQNRVRDNYKIMQLGVPNISVQDSESISFALENSECTYNKLEIIKMSIQDGFGETDFSDLFLQLKKIQLENC